MQYIQTHLPEVRLVSIAFFCATSPAVPAYLLPNAVNLSRHARGAPWRSVLAAYCGLPATFAVHSQTDSLHAALALHCPSLACCALQDSLDMRPRFVLLACRTRFSFIVFVSLACVPSSAERPGPSDAGPGAVRTQPPKNKSPLTNLAHCLHAARCRAAWICGQAWCSLARGGWSVWHTQSFKILVSLLGDSLAA